MIARILPKNKYLVVLVLLLMAFLLAALSLYARAFFFQPVLVKSVEYTDINFDSMSEEPELAKAKEFVETTNGDFKELQISFKMKVNSINNWNNIFQTATFNKGVRMELASPSMLGVVISDGTGTGLLGFKLTDSLKLGEWYSVKLDLDRDKNLKVFLNDDLVVDARDERMNYLISDIAVGTGFAKLRPFDGEIAGFNLSYSLFGNNWRTTGLMFFYLLVIALCINIAFCAPKRGRV